MLPQVAEIDGETRPSNLPDIASLEQGIQKHPVSNQRDMIERMVERALPEVRTEVAITDDSVMEREEVVMFKTEVKPKIHKTMPVVAQPNPIISKPRPQNTDLEA